MNFSWISTLGVVRHSRRRLSIFARGGRGKQRGILHGNAPKAHHKTLTSPTATTEEKSSESSSLSTCCFSNVRNCKSFFFGCTYLILKTLVY